MSSNMKILVILPLILNVVHAIQAEKQDLKAKTTSSPVNTIQQQQQKYEMVYQPQKYQQPVQQMQQVHLQPLHLQLHQFPQLQQKAHYVPIQVIPKPYYVQQQQQPQAMIIIAQPALLPQSLVYGNPTQQLLNYFHSNPQAKYQLLHGNYQQPIQQQAQTQNVQPTATYMHPVLASPIGNYILTAPQVTTQIAAQPQLIAQTSPTPALQYTAQQPQQLQIHQSQAQQLQLHQAQQPQQVQVHQTQTQQQPAQLSSLAQLAQLAAQQYVSTQMKAAPAIVTGFEHFTPEQQAQIKAQLNTHLGTNYHAVTNANNNNNQYSAKYVAEQDNSNFVPSPQIKTEQVTTQTADILKTRYMKGKN